MAQPSDLQPPASSLKPVLKPQASSYHSYPFWIPRFWHGMDVVAWLNLAARNRFAISLSRWPMALIVSALSLSNFACSLVQRAVYNRKLRATEVRKAPVFIIGHWRSGTTHLHELLVLDRQFAFPTTYECFAPCHAMVTAWIALRWFNFLIPAKRPMDNVATGWGRPQEDEFALCSLGVGSPYNTIAFPNHPPQDQRFLDLVDLTPAERDRWRNGLLGFLKQVTVRDPKRIVLKSPPHTARIKTLVEMFPDARFVHIVRDPYVLFPSTIRLWQSLYEIQGFQNPRFDGLEEHVLETFERMYRAFESQKQLIRPNRLCELRYEDLVREPIAQMRRIYDSLELEGFDQVLPQLQSYLSTVKDYKTNRYGLPPEIHAEITSRWGDYARRYGYSTE